MLVSLLVSFLVAQSSFDSLLPPGAQVIETATLATAKPRALVLWMQNPKKEMSEEPPTCIDLVYGDHWVGPIRLSLVDPSSHRLLNTVEFQGAFSLDQTKESLWSSL